MLEIISKGSAAEDHSTPLLFVHGAWHGAWCWDEHFLDYFAERGYACLAPSLRGHAGSPGIERLRRTRIRDYVDDLIGLVDSLPVPPVLVGHSMGGFVVQKFLERRRCAGAVLLAAIPPAGALGATLRTARHHPMPFLKANAELRLGPMVATPDLARQLFLSAATPDADVVGFQRRLQDESYLAYLDMVMLDLVRTKRVASVPMLVLGAENDVIVSVREVRRTGEVYGTEAEIFPAMAHDMMLEPQWSAVADRIAAWLESQGR